MEIGRILLAVGFFALLVGIYIVLFLMNKKTPKPAGCEHLEADCEGCHVTSCHNHPSHAVRSE